MHNKSFLKSLPDEEYRLMVGTGLCAFNQNNGIIVNNILEVDDGRYNWYDLISLTSGRLSERAAKTIAKKCGGTEIPTLFDEIILMRNAIAHSFQVIDDDGRIIMRHKERIGRHKFGDVDEAYLKEFIKKNIKLAKMLKAFNRRHRNTDRKGRPNPHANPEDC